MVHDHWKALLPILKDLWHALVAVTLHFIGQIEIAEYSTNELHH